MRKIKLLFSLIYKISPSYIFLVIFGSLLGSIQVLGNVIFPKLLIDELMGEANIKKIVFIAVGLVAFNFLIGFIIKTYKRLLEVRNAYVSRKLTEAMAKKIMDVEYKFLEDPYYLDLKERAVFACNNQGALSNIIRSTASAISGIITLIGLITIMLMLSYILVVILLLGSTITIIISWLFKKYQAKFFQGIIPLNRRYGYYLGLSLDQRFSKDIRLYNMGPMFNESVNKFNRLINDEFKKFYKFQGLVNGFQKVINAIQIGCVFLFVSLRVFTARYGRKISIGDFTMYVSSAISFANTFDKLFMDLFAVTLMLDFLDPFMEFMELKDASACKGKYILGDIETVEFKNLSFSYPKSDKMVLDDISFAFHKGEKISIVGLNGAGKTTLIKLLCRLYEPTKGRILINNIDIWDYDYDSYINKIAAVFQDFRLFAYSIKENIVGDASLDQDKIDRIINQVGLDEKIRDLPKGLETALNKNYDEDGVELSGGQGQKVAIARALYKEASMVILDEPTSALDPLAEADIYKNFNDLVVDKTAIYISHRMSSSVFCDRVLIVDGGKVSDFDTHQNLMKKKDSLYYKLFNSQAENYQLD
jgi:ABC-type multidrug transport system fused ATPase/permease subunit